MTAYRVLKCDGTRHGQRCRGALTIPPAVEALGWFERVGYAVRAGWTGSARNGIGDVCPSRGHDHQLGEAEIGDRGSP